MFDVCDSDESPCRETSKVQISARLYMPIRNGKRYIFPNLIRWSSIKGEQTDFVISMISVISNDFIWFQVISGDFRWFQVISSDFKWFRVISSWFRGLKSVCSPLSSIQLMFSHVLQENFLGWQITFESDLCVSCSPEWIVKTIENFLFIICFYEDIDCLRFDFRALPCFPSWT
jgi:hypothetical protein